MINPWKKCANIDSCHKYLTRCQKPERQFRRMEKSWRNSMRVSNTFIYFTIDNSLKRSALISDIFFNHCILSIWLSEGSEIVRCKAGLLSCRNLLAYVVCVCKSPHLFSTGVLISPTTSFGIDFLKLDSVCNAGSSQLQMLWRTYQNQHHSSRTEYGRKVFLANETWLLLRGQY